VTFFQREERRMGEKDQGSEQLNLFDFVHGTIEVTTEGDILKARDSRTSGYYSEQLS
jgi:hypothetical protein